MPVTIVKTIKVQEVRAGENVVVDKPGGVVWSTALGQMSIMVAREIKRGTKWVEARDEGAKLIFREELDSEVEVIREEPTEDERAEQRREYRNQTIYDFVKDADEEWAHAQSQFAKEIEGGYEVDRYHFTYSRLIHAQAEHYVKRAIISMRDGMQRQAERETDTEVVYVDWVEAFDHWRDLALENLMDGFRGDSRSTSQISNILEDVQRETIAKIAGRRRFNRLDY